MPGACAPGAGAVAPGTIRCWSLDRRGSLKYRKNDEIRLTGRMRVSPSASRPSRRPASSGRTRRSRDPGPKASAVMRLLSASPVPRSSSARRDASARKHRHVAVGLGLDGLRELRALRADVGSFALALRLHALEHRLAVLLRQVGAAQADVHHLDAEAVRLAVHVVADLLHQPGAVRADHRGETRFRQHGADSRVDDRGQAQVGARDVVRRSGRSAADRSRGSA